MIRTGGIRAFDRKYWERLVKRQITDAEYSAAAAAILLNDRFRDRRRKKRAGLKAIQESKR
jgi:hypothetical protein